MKYPWRYLIDIVVLLSLLSVPACAVYEGWQPSPPVVDMSGAYQGNPNDFPPTN